MYIREYMNTDIVTVSSNALIYDVLKLMQTSRRRGLPVEEQDKLVGFITEDSITGIIEDTKTLTAGCPDFPDAKGLQFLMRVGDLMETNLVTLHPDTTVEEAIVVAQQHRVGTLPVVTEANELIGIITAARLYRVIVDALGFGDNAFRLHIYEHPKADRPFGEIFDIINHRGGKILSLFHVNPPGFSRTDCILHL